MPFLHKNTLALRLQPPNPPLLIILPRDGPANDIDTTCPRLCFLPPMTPFINELLLPVNFSAQGDLCKNILQLLPSTLAPSLNEAVSVTIVQRVMDVPDDPGALIVCRAQIDYACTGVITADGGEVIVGVDWVDFVVIFGP